MVRIGGGFEKLDVYLDKIQDNEMEKIKRIMKETDKSYISVLLDLL